ncbi:MAG: methyl-accepting chemotaxis protein, partial [Aliivibrio sp.]|nr:methyl-accepting chemotaxis protein [Aliivibrio sp.]
MKQLGFKNLLLLSITILVGLSVSITSYIAYLNEKEVLTNLIIKKNSDYVRQQAMFIENGMNGKALGLAKVAKLYDNLTAEGTTEQFVKLANTIAFSMDLNSSVVAFENGDGYWNQTADVWPDHKFSGDIRSEGYYQLARKNQSSTITEPYSEGDYGATEYWISIVHQIKNGMISVDM